MAFQKSSKKELGAVQSLICCWQDIVIIDQSLKQKGLKWGEEWSMIHGGVFNSGCSIRYSMEPSLFARQSLDRRPEIYKKLGSRLIWCRIGVPGGVSATIKTSFAEQINFWISIVNKAMMMPPFLRISGNKEQVLYGEIQLFPYDVPAAKANQNGFRIHWHIMGKKPMLYRRRGAAAYQEIVRPIFRNSCKGTGIGWWFREEITSDFLSLKISRLLKREFYFSKAIFCNSCLNFSEWGDKVYRTCIIVQLI